MGPFTETKQNFMEIFIATDIASVQLFFNIFATGIETHVIPWDQLLNTCVVEVCRLGFEPLGDNHLHLSAHSQNADRISLVVGKDGNHWEGGPGCRVDD
jgi:hypothetical protein